MEDGKPVCSCHEGFYLAKDGDTCEDIDECQNENGGCSQMCINRFLKILFFWCWPEQQNFVSKIKFVLKLNAYRPGTFLCECGSGYSILDEKTCVDINECLLNNGHGPCQVISNFPNVNICLIYKPMQLLESIRQLNAIVYMFIYNMTL